ncbi:hypothetical protein D4R86_01110 [bacterium]|nr:MAG: hypothetical protein D4R86_01110 [bacterium]
MWNCYIGLKCSQMKVASCLMSNLLSNKMYNDSQQDRRIYTSVCLTVEDVLAEMNSAKYYNGANIETDVANLRKRFIELHGGNIFYQWKYRGLYIFIMERNFRAWTYYNSKATVPPRTLKRLLPLLSKIMARMATFYKVKNGVVSDRVKLENSLGCFVNNMLSKMAIVVSKDLPRWENNKSLFEYVLKLEALLANIDDEEGLEEDDGFMFRLPPSVRKEVFKERGIVEADIMTKLDMEKIIPQNGKLGDKKKRKVSDKVKKTKTKTKSNVDPTVAIEAQPLIYEIAINPFEDAKMFVKFFQKGVRNFNNNAILPYIGAETKDAGLIMDKMKDEGRKDDREFLLSWMRWHFQYNLKGQKIYNIKHTCVKKFGETFTDYSSTYQSIKDKMNLIPE